MGKVLFIREDDIDFCYQYMLIKGVYCQTPDIKDPLCDDGDLEALKKCLISLTKHPFITAMIHMCKKIWEKQPDMRYLCKELEPIVDD